MSMQAVCRCEGPNLAVPVRFARICTTMVAGGESSRASNTGCQAAYRRATLQACDGGPISVRASEACLGPWSMSKRSRPARLPVLSARLCRAVVLPERRADLLAGLWVGHDAQLPEG